MQSAIEGLEPERVFWWFDRICSIPHGSGHERELSGYIRDYFQKLDYPVYQDLAYNLIITKPGSAGYENLPPVILEAHLDMVWEKEEASGHDFLRDPIRLIREGNRLRADKTTLGADDGTGVAFALAILEDKELFHPPLEVVLTTHEEDGLIGIQALDFDRLKGRSVLNLDCSDEGIVVGCAGASVGEIIFQEKREEIGEEFRFFSIKIAGLQGGHCGLHIIEERGNANVLLARLLGELQKETDLWLAQLWGGSQYGAIPRTAGCILAVRPEQEENFRAQFETVAQALKHELFYNDPQMDAHLAGELPAQPVFGQAGTERLIQLMNLLPSGLLAMDRTAEKLPETSCNIGVVKTEGDEVRICCNCRSSFGSKKRWLLDKCRMLSRQAGAAWTVLRDYPEWEYNPDSPLRRLIEETYQELEGEPLIVERSHGGNECGIFYRKIPHADIVCMGTKIHNAHSPQEWVGIDVIQKEYRLLREVLKNMKQYEGGRFPCTSV